ncbi:MAG TPA: AI-2E family transporter [Pyrinomonadaceae bacterium]|nr:AI-2E family transporter [Pyrinomonadaceae bacterium]
MEENINRKEWLHRNQILTIVLIAATAAAFYLCYIIALPFLASLVWALALAVLVFPVYRRIKDYLDNENLASVLTTVFVALVVVVPVVLVSRQIAREIWRNAETVREGIKSGEWRTQIEQNQFGSRILRLVEEEMDLRATLEQSANNIPGYVSNFLSGSIWILFQLLITFFALFFFLRDHDSFLRGVRRLIPLSKKETNAIFKRVTDTLYATVFGEILIALIQGVLGGLMFWILGLPAPFLWGFAIGLFGFLPVIGAWMIWVPAAVYLMMQGELIRGIVLIAWGILALSVFTTVLYPILIGERLRLHTLVVFIAIIGGVIAFGTVGIILGPLVLALTISLIEIWKNRMDHQEDAAEAA